MKVDSLEDLKSAFAKWRRAKRHVRERTPEDLLARARRAAKKHGLPAVVRVTRVERALLFRDGSAGRSGPGEASKQRRVMNAASPRVPGFSRLDLSAPSEPIARPLAEVETGTGAKIRVFEETPKMLYLLALACGLEGVQ